MSRHRSARRVCARRLAEFEQHARRCARRRPAVAWTGDAIEIIDQTAVARDRASAAARARPSEVIAAIQRLGRRAARRAIGIAGALGVVLAAAPRPTGDARAGRRDRRGAPDRRQPALGGHARARRARRPTQRGAGASSRRTLARSAGQRSASSAARSCSALSSAADARATPAGSWPPGWGTSRSAVVYAKAQAGEPVEVFALRDAPADAGRAADGVGARPTPASR